MSTPRSPLPLADRVPGVRIDVVNEAPARPEREWVLYWMIAQRRTRWNFGLQRAVEWAEELGKPLVVFEALRVGYRWASDRLHRFAIDGMTDNAAHCEAAGVAYFPYVEPAPDADKGLLAALAARSCVVVTDEYPHFFLPHMVRSAGRRIDVRLEQVDSNGLLPLRATNKEFVTAFSFRAFLQKQLQPHLAETPRPDPLARGKFPKHAVIPKEILKRWPPADPKLLAGDASLLAKLPIDHDDAPASLRVGSQAAEKQLRRFVEHGLPRYADERSQPDSDAASGLSPYFHWGFVSSHQVLAAIAKRDAWTPAQLPAKGGGTKEGWWQLSREAEAFLDEAITWRELGFNMCHRNPAADSYDALPGWAKATLEKHAGDPRPAIFTRAQLEAGETYDPLWNAAQRQLVHEGRIHNYLRMLWGKRVLEWTRHPREAAEILLAMNDRFALDGRDPNSVSGVYWVFGRYDRPWGPERPIYGQVRYMSSENTARKLRVKSYLARYGAERAQEALPGF